MKTLLFITSVLVFTPFAPAQFIDWLAVHTITVRGIDRLYDTDFDAAARAFDSVRHMAPGDPRGYFFGSMVEFWRYTLGRNERDYEKFLDESEHVVDLCEGLIDNNSRDAKARFYLGGILGYRGLAHQANGSMLKAVKEGKVGFGYLEEAVQMDSTLYDARMGFGLFKYLVAKVPRSLKWVTSLLGFSGDLEGGLTLLKEAAAHGTYTRSEAGFFVAQFLFSEQRYDEAFSYLTPLLSRHPNNALFQVLAANWYLRTNKSAEALAAANRAAEINSRNKLRYAEETVYSTLGGIYFSRNEFAKARDNYAIYFQKMPNPERIGNWFYYRAGLSQEICGDRTKALAWYGRMKNPDDTKRANEVYLYRRGQELLRRPLGEAEILLIEAGNVADRKQYDSALVLFRAALEKSRDDQDMAARILYAQQQMSYTQERFDDVAAIGSRILALTPGAERWILPHALFKQGQAFARLGRTAEARAALARAASYDQYDFQLNLEGRIEEEQEKLPQAQ